MDNAAEASKHEYATAFSIYTKAEALLQMLGFTNNFLDTLR